MRMGGSPVGAGAVPTVTTLTLSSRTKATLFRIMLWRCWASSEHGIARPFDDFVQEFNTERPHEALAMKCPAEIYSASSRPYSGLPDLTYPLHDRDVLVTACGRICMHRKRVNISTVLAGQRLGIKEVDDGIWIVSFMHYDLGFIDLEQKTLQPLDTPFGTGLSPMS